jgi:hypothetical protein
MKEDEEVAALYRLPLGEFTAARNALAKTRGAARAGVRELQKPHAAAWAVNQLFWDRRATYDAVITAAHAMRQAHARMLSGRQANVPEAEDAHRDAVRAAVQAIRELATAAGETLSAMTLEAVSETLRALPSDDEPGQLTQPLKPLGFGALFGVLGQGSGVQGPGSGSPAVLAKEKAAAKKEAAERAARKKALAKALRAAKNREVAAEAALADSRKALAKVERDYQAARDRVQFLEKQRSDSEQDAHRRDRELQEAANARMQAEQDLADASN